MRAPARRSLMSRVPAPGQRGEMTIARGPDRKSPASAGANEISLAEQQRFDQSREKEEHDHADERWHGRHSQHFHDHQRVDDQSSETEQRARSPPDEHSLRRK